MTQWKKLSGSVYRPIIGSAEGEPIFQKFIKEFGFDEFWYHPHVNFLDRLLEGKRSFNSAHEYLQDIPPFNDHAIAFKNKKNGHIIYVYHVYNCMTKDEVLELEQWCNKRDLIYVISNTEKSFYIPGVTTMIMIMSNDTYVDLWETKQIQQYEDI